MKKRPLIAITPSYSSEGYVKMKPTYLDAVWSAGGMPVFVAYTKNETKLDEYTALFDGFLFAGGVDIDPKYYGEDITSDEVEVCDARDGFELALFERVKKTEKPVLGICRGIQLINVGMGGSLHQHIGGHRQKEGGTVRNQRINVHPDTPLAEISGGRTEMLVNSFHHQAVKEIAPGLRAAAYAEDGICECIYLPGHRFFIGVQWHPELYWHLDRDAAALFETFVRAAGDE
ncbi:MAG: gamma-glutamyl-gamma-aminobutyrate hydrolase family protein [Clostridiales bacterium]|nr:gamma-glutamyl-gamma-aminobutyrate hydrolase family protein [Clostridiales bacterium]